ncbi:MAG: DNA cytosine methyltransferase [Deltaproteobacteria bacterium]|jgi:DNA (cytosine-5)-methyltransferase 1|nr:DNA cytosine methyltransferase [Deltaproteobacteria bacterium]
MSKFRLGELFCGPGGIAYGAATARCSGDGGIVHQWATDSDSDACNTYAANICSRSPDSVVWGDIRRLDIENDLGGRGDIDALSFGFPCNDFSIVGEKKGIDGAYGPLYSYGVKALKIFQPSWFLAENVGGLQKANDGRAFKLILSEMKKAGYTVTPHLYKFEQYGLPQARHRIIIVGIHRSQSAEFRIPSPAPYAGADNSCRTALENPPIPSDAPNNELTRQSERVVRRLNYIKPGENAFTASLPEDLQIKTATKISQIYKRLDPDKPAYTVTGSGGGGTHIYHWSEPRALTNRERARLQTFPDSYVFSGSKESVRRQIGMAVPCAGARILFEAILNTFAGAEYEWIKPNISL